MENAKKQECSSKRRGSGAVTLTRGFHKGPDSPFDRWVQGEQKAPCEWSSRDRLARIQPAEGWPKFPKSTGRLFGRD